MDLSRELKGEASPGSRMGHELSQHVVALVKIAHRRSSTRSLHR